MNITGQRFHIDLDHDPPASSSFSSSALPSLDIVREVRERTVNPPRPPALNTTPTGFPAHKKRARPSTFKQQRSSPSTLSNPPGNPPTSSFDADQHRQIHHENTQRLAAMSSTEIAEEREELMARLDPSLVERLLKRANLDDGRGDTDVEPSVVKPATSEPIATSESPPQSSPLHTPTNTSTPIPKPTGKAVTAEKSVHFTDDVDDMTTTQPPVLDTPSIHFPTAAQPPELDPAAPDFLEHLHAKYFPSLPTDPSKLAWMAPIPTHGSPADRDSPYSPHNETFAPTTLRFNFRGFLLPPRIARAVPVSKGLHHHGDAPEAAGYTVPELAHLARSSFPSQRCLAFQTLGRLLYRLGRGEWGVEGEIIPDGLWRCLDEGRVLDTLHEAAAAEGGHAGSRAYAIEALWLWQKGGGRRKHAAV